MTELYGQRVQTTVNTKYLPFVADTILNSNVMFQRTVRSAKKWSGRAIRIPVKYAKNTTGGSFAGFDTLSVAATDNRVNMEYTPCWYQITVALPMDELAVADTEDKVLDLMKLTIQSDTEDMSDDLGTIFYADGTGNSNKDPLGLAALVDDGSAVSTLAGLPRTTYTTLKSTVTASSGTLSLAKMDTLWNACTAGMNKPTVIPTTESVYSFYGQLLRPQERINKDVSRAKGMAGGTGFTALQYMSAGVVADEKSTSGQLLFLNEDTIDFYALNNPLGKAVQYSGQIDGNDYDAPVGLGFSWSGWLTPSNQAGVVGHIFFGGQFVTKNPRFNGKLTGITGI
jgi:hypothetical protein